MTTAIASAIARSHVNLDVLGKERRSELIPWIFKVRFLVSALTAPLVGGAVA